MHPQSIAPRNSVPALSGVSVMLTRSRTASR